MHHARTVIPYHTIDFIKATGISKIRGALVEKEKQQSNSTKSRERVRPKLGKIDIDYQILHDAFFKYQTKPQMTVFGMYITVMTIMFR